jgi:alpha-tubulin suppressor-like RCC1 family protein
MRTCVVWTALLSLGGCGLGNVGADLDAWRAVHADAEVSDSSPDVVPDAPVDTATDTPDAPVDVAAACTPGSCDDGNLCTDDSCKPASGCVHEPNVAPCDDGMTCTGPDACSDGQCTGPMRTWTRTSALAASLEEVVAVRALPDGRVLSVGNVLGNPDTRRGRVQRLSILGKVEAEALSDPGLRWTVAVPLPNSTLLLGVRKTADQLAFATAVLGLDAVQPAAVVTQSDAADEPVAAHALPDGTVIVLALAPDKSANRLVLRHLQADGTALGRVVVAGTLVQSLAGWAPHPFGGHLIAGITPKGQAWVARVDASGQRIGEPRFHSWPGATNHQVAGVLATGSGFLLVGTCQVGPDTRMWLVTLDRKGDLVSSQLGVGLQDSVSAVQAVDPTTFLATGSTQGTPSFRPTLWKLDVTGKLVWSRSFEAHGTGMALAKDGDGSVLVGGAVLPETGGDQDAWLARTNAWGLTDCKGGGSCAGPANGCDDGNPCTTDACTLGGACTATTSALPCQDGNGCTQDDTCADGECKPGPADTCDDELVCTLDACSPKSGCTFTNLAIGCDDGNACTLSDACSGTVCAGGVAVGCNDGDPCTTDSCDPSVGCVTQSAVDGTGCGGFINNVPQVCATGKCVQPWSTLVSAGPDFSCSFHGSQLSCWGANDHGQLGDGGGAAVGTPVAIPVTGAYTLTAGDGFACVYGSYDTTCWGRNDLGQAGGIPGPKAVTPTASEFDGSIIGLAAGTAHVCLLSGKGAVFCRGSNALHQFDHPGATDGPAWVPALDLPPIKSIAAGGNQTCAVTQAGATLCWGQAKLGGVQLAVTDTPQVIALPGEPDSLAVGGTFACARLKDGTVQCWGRNDFGQLGAGTVVDATQGPQPVLGLKDVWSITAGADHACVIRAPGEVWCWGANLAGQLGNASKVSGGQIAQPVLAVTQPSLDVVAAGNHTCMRSIVGVVQCWGAGGLPDLVPQSADPVVLPASLP